MNGDGLSDVILGTSTGGMVYVLFGKEEGYGSGEVDVAQIAASKLGFAVDTGAAAEIPVAGMDVSV